MGREELKWRQLKHNQLMSPQGPHFSPHSTAKTNDKSTNLRKNGIYWYSDVVTASVNPEKTRMKSRVSYRIFGLGGEIYWCINEARKCERRGLGASPSLALPPPPEFFGDLAPLAKFGKEEIKQLAAFYGEEA